MQTHEIDVTGLTNEIYVQREAVIKLFDRIGDMHINDIETAEQDRDTKQETRNGNPENRRINLKITATTRR